MKYYNPRHKLKIDYPVGEGILYDTLDGKLLFETEEIYSAFNFVLQDRLRNGHMDVEEFNNVAHVVKSLFKEMWYKLREGNLGHRVIHNWAILEEYREKLRQHPTIRPHVTDAENFLRSNY